MVADGLSNSTSNVTSIPLIRTPQGWIAFSAIFMAKLGSCLTLTLQQTVYVMILTTDGLGPPDWTVFRVGPFSYVTTK